MGLLVRMGFLAGAGALAYKMLCKNKDKGSTQEGEPVFSSGVVRDAAQTDDVAPATKPAPSSTKSWDKVDEANDASFPASDPPAVP